MSECEVSVCVVGGAWGVCVCVSSIFLYDRDHVAGDIQVDYRVLYWLIIPDFISFSAASAA